MKKLISMLILSAIMCACGCPAWAVGNTSEPLPITGYFEWQPSDAENEDDATLEGNEEYMDVLNSLAVDSSAAYEGATLRFDVDKVIATDDLTALTWQVTNTTDMPLYVQSGELDVAFSGIEYDLCGGLMWKNFLIRPGETLNARFQGVLWEHFEPGNGVFTLNMKVYEIAAAAIPEDYYTDTTGLYAGGEFIPDESLLNRQEDISLSVPMTMGASDVRSALKDGQPLESDFGRYAMRITKADMNAACTEIAYERIYPTEADARADSPTGANFWHYEYLAGDGSNWIHASFGNIPDDPVELADGRWAWQIEFKAYFMFTQPDAIIMHPRYFEDGKGYDPESDADTSEDIELDFTASLTKMVERGGRKFGWAYGFAQL